jgi:hypothetical protein
VVVVSLLHNWRHNVVSCLAYLSLCVFGVSHLHNAVWHVELAILGIFLSMAALACLCITSTRITLGSKALYIPLCLLVLLGIVQGIDVGSKLFSLSLLAFYLLGVNGVMRSRIGPFIIITGGTLSLLLQVLLGTYRMGGIFGNAHIASGMLLVALLLANVKAQQYLIPIAAVGILLTGSEEGVLGLTVLLVMMFLRKDVSTFTLLSLACVIALASCLSAVHTLDKMWFTVPDRASAWLNIGTPGSWDVALGYRLDPIVRLFSPFNVWGTGYDPLNLEGTTIHNAVLRALFEVGIIGALTWLWTCIIALLRSSATYLCIMLLTLSMFDHFLWTTLAPLFWIVIGHIQTVEDDTINVRSALIWAW